MKKIVFLLLIFVLPITGQNNDADTLYIASWNIENLFDTEDDPEKRDEDFTPEGRKKWDKEKLAGKLKNLAKVIQEMNDGNGPDLIGFQEVENEVSAKMLVDEVGSDIYGYVFHEGPDKRGIDNFIMYKKNKFDFIAQKGVEVVLPDKWPTRDILHASFSTSDNDTLNIFVNHWPSRRGGLEKSEKNRVAAAQKLQEYIKENIFCTTTSGAVILGDFNDEPDNKSISETLGAKAVKCGITTKSNDLYNLATKLDTAGYGSYMYKQKWNMLDQIIVSGNLIKSSNITYINSSFEIIKPEYTVTKNGYYKGSSIPTFGGKKYLGGYSDHFAVGARFVNKK